MNTTLTGREKFEAKVKELKKDTEEKKLAEVKSANSALEKTRAMIQANPELQKRMQGDAREEQEKSGGALPFLKVYIANRSTMTLADGSDPTNGYFYYTPTQEQYPEVHCHILTISRGFRMPGIANEKGEIKNNWNHIVSGIMLNDEPKPFWIFISGQARVNALWEFQKELRAYNNAGIPSFPLLVKLTTGKGPEPAKKTQSRATVVNFEVEKDDEGSPIIVTNDAEYLALRENVHSQDEYIEAYINRKEVVEVKKPKVLTSDDVKTGEATPDPDGY